MGPVMLARRLCPLLLAALIAGGLGCAALQESMGGVLGGPAGGGSLDAATVAAGIREALRVGTDNTVVSTSRVDGFLGNALIRIALPDQLRAAGSAMRAVGLGEEVDELEIGMNRAAELAAGEAREVFWNAIKGMTITDAFAILNGTSTAATEYFRGKTYAELESRFRPIVGEKIGEIGLAALYGKVAGAYNTLPIPGRERLVDLDTYVTERALSGLFTVLGTEEQKIRQDPAARTTELLRKVFGS